jgi:MFS transporter, FSR family, fosmidomycin resistance protein
LTKNPNGFEFRKIVLISAGHFSHDVFSSFLAIFLPLLIAKFSLSMAMAGAFTVFFRAPSLLNPVLGVISDRVNLFRLAIWGPAITAAGMSLLGVAPSYTAVCLLLFLAGFSAAMFHVLGPVMIARVAGPNLGRGMSFWMTGGEMARTFGPILGVWAVSFWGLEGCFPVMILGILASFFLHIQLKNTDFSIAPQSGGSLSGTWKSLRRVMLPLTGIMFAAACMVSTLSAFLPTLMVSSGKSLWFGGVALALLQGFGTLGTLGGGTLSDRLGRRRVLAIAMPLSSLLMLGFLYAPGWLTIPFLVLLGLVLFTIAPIELAIVQDHSAYHRGTANGIFMCISFLIMAGVTVSVGWLSDHVGMQAALAVSAVLGLAGVPFVLMLPARPSGDVQVP